MAKKETDTKELEVFEKYERDDGFTRISAGGDECRIETFVPNAFGSKLKMGDKVKVILETL